MVVVEGLVPGVTTIPASRAHEFPALSLKDAFTWTFGPGDEAELVVADPHPVWKVSAFQSAVGAQAYVEIPQRGGGWPLGTQ